MLKYKLHGEEPNDPDAAKRLRREEHWYVVYQGLLYRKSFSLPLLRCATEWDAEKILEEIHEGVCGNHLGGKTLALKALRAGYWWPYMTKH